MVASPAHEARNGFMQRSRGAHTNMLECLVWHYGSLVFAVLNAVDRDLVERVAIVYFALRVFYCWAYMSSPSALKGFLRTTVWAACVGLTCWLFAKAADLNPAVFIGAFVGGILISAAGGLLLHPPSETSAPMPPQ